MKKVLIIILFSIQIFALAEDKNTEKLVFKDIKAHINRNCAKCVSDLKRAENEILKSTKQLEKLIASTKDQKLLFEMKEFLADTYGMVGVVFPRHGNLEDKEYKEYREKMKLLYEEIYKTDRCFNPKLIMIMYRFKDTDKERLKILQPVLRLQSTLFDAKIFEGKLLLKEGNIEKGLESLILAAYLASDYEARSASLDLLRYWKKYKRKDIALMLFRKVYKNKKSDEKIKQMLDEMWGYYKE